MGKNAGLCSMSKRRTLMEVLPVLMSCAGFRKMAAAATVAQPAAGWREASKHCNKLS